jgi:hypothetical protein
MSRRICTIIVVLSFTALFLAACGGAAQPTATAPTASQPVAAPTKAPPAEPTTTALPPTAEPTAAPAQPAALSGTKIDMNNPIFKAYYAVYNKFPRRTQSEAFDPKTKQTSTILIETDAKDHLHLETNSMGSTGDVTVSLVIISPTLYLKQGATWQKLPDAQSGALLGSMLTNADLLQQELNAFGELASYTVTPVGPEDVNGVPAMAYSSEFTLKDGKSSKGKAWLGADGLLVRDHIETADGIVVTTTYEFDPNIKVEAPIP